MFEGFPKLTRFSHGWTITEKLDGTNAQVLIQSANLIQGEHRLGYDLVTDLAIAAGSRTRMLTASADNLGFAKWVKANAEELITKLGEGRHFGEWVGLGINRGYGLKEKRFALFNTGRWAGVALPERVDLVPVLASGYLSDPALAAANVMISLNLHGSLYAPGFKNPEGVVLHHGPSNSLFKKTFDYDEAGKWAENQARKAAA